MDNDIPADSPLRIFLKSGLPKEFASTYPHGHISGHPRVPAAQKAFEARKATILRTMTQQQMEKAYQDTVGKILAQVEEDRKKTEEVMRELQIAEDQRSLERSILLRMREKKKGRAEEGLKTEED